jgi:hypothetical protein
MVIDTAHSHLFVTGYSAMAWAGYVGGADSKVLALNLDGSLAATFTGIDGAAGLFLDAPANRLYVAAHDADEIQAIKTDTLTLGSSWSLGADATCPTFAVKAGGYLWSNIGCGASAGLLARTDPATSAVTVFNTANGGRQMTAHGSIVYSADPGLLAFDVSTGAPTLVTALGPGVAPDPVTQMFVTPSGNDLVTAGPLSIVPVWKSSDLSADGSYPVQSFAASMSSDGGWLAAASPASGFSAESTSVFPAGSSTAVNTFPYQETGETTGAARHGLQLSADGSTLFTISGVDFSGQGVPVLTILDDVTTPRSTMSLNGPDGSVQVTADLSIPGTLTFTDGGAAASQTIHVSRTNPDASVTTLPDATTDVNGAFTINDAPPVAGNYTYDAWFDGTASHRYAVATTTILAEKFWPVLTLQRSSSVVTYPSKVTLTAKVVGYDPDVVVTIYAKPKDGTKKVIASGSVAGTGGVLSVTQKPQRLTTYTATSSETAAYLSVTKAVSVNVRPQIVGTMKGGYASSGGARLYHYTSSCPQKGTGCPTSTFLTKPNLAGGTLSIHLEIKVNGRWKLAARFAPRIGKDATTGVRWVYRDRSVIGLPSRVLAHFAGDSGHTAANSAYLYFRVTN